MIFPVSEDNIQVPACSKHFCQGSLYHNGINGQLSKQRFVCELVVLKVAVSAGRQESWQFEGITDCLGPAITFLWRSMINIYCYLIDIVQIYIKAIY